MSGHDDLDDNQFPDNNELIPYVIGSNIMQKNGETVMCWGRVTSINSNGDNFVIRTADEQDITVHLKSPLNEHIDGWVEIHGVAQGKTIKCEDFIIFPAEQTGDVDKDGHKALVQLLGAIDDPWNLGENESGQGGHEGLSYME